MRIITILLALGLGTCGGDAVVSLQMPKPVCKVNGTRKGSAPAPARNRLPATVAA